MKKVVDLITNTVTIDNVTFFLVDMAQLNTPEKYIAFNTGSHTHRHTAIWSFDKTRVTLVAIGERQQERAA